MIAYANKSSLASGEIHARGRATVSSDLHDVDSLGRGDVQSSEEEPVFLAPEKDESGEMETLRGKRIVHERFLTLVATWRRECGMLSSTTQKAVHPAYQQIIGMGQDALPLIFRELDSTPGHWFWALRAITGQDPVPPEHVGEIPQMTDAWLRWGRERGYL